MEIQAYLGTSTAYLMACTATRLKFSSPVLQHFSKEKEEEEEEEALPKKSLHSSIHPSRPSFHFFFFFPFAPVDLVAAARAF